MRTSPISSAPHRAQPSSLGEFSRDATFCLRKCGRGDIGEHFASDKTSRQHGCGSWAFHWQTPRNLDVRLVIGKDAISKAPLRTLMGKYLWCKLPLRNWFHNGTIHR